MKTMKLTMKALDMSLSMLRGMAIEEVVEAIEAAGADAMQDAIEAGALDEAVEVIVIDARETTDKAVIIMVVLKPVADVIEV